MAPLLHLRSRTALAVAGGAALVVLGLGLFWVFAWVPRTHIPAEVVYQYRIQFEPGRQLAPGWKLLSVGRNIDRPSVLVHRVEVPPALAGELVMMGGSERGRRAASIACPEASHPIWSQLTRRQDVEVELYTDQGKFETVSCRASVF